MPAWHRLGGLLYFHFFAIEFACSSAATSSSILSFSLASLLRTSALDLACCSSEPVMRKTRFEGGNLTIRR
jgi:hypothetical protein